MWDTHRWPIGSKPSPRSGCLDPPQRVGGSGIVLRCVLSAALDHAVRVGRCHAFSNAPVRYPRIGVPVALPRMNQREARAIGIPFRSCHRCRQRVLVGTCGKRRAREANTHARTREQSMADFSVPRSVLHSLLETTSPPVIALRQPTPSGNAMHVHVHVALRVVVRVVVRVVARCSYALALPIATGKEAVARGILAWSA